MSKECFMWMARKLVKSKYIVEISEIKYFLLNHKLHKIFFRYKMYKFHREQNIVLTSYWTYSIRLHKFIAVALLNFVKDSKYLQILFSSIVYTSISDADYTCYAPKLVLLSKLTAVETSTLWYWFFPHRTFKYCLHFFWISINNERSQGTSSEGLEVRCLRRIDSGLHRIR